MNCVNSLALALVVLLAPCALGDRFYNSIDQEYNSPGDNRNIVRCVSGADCGAGYCSVMGMQRYSEPRCQPRGQQGEPCRMYADKPENKTLHFPHVTMECQDVYMQFCPCAEGLVCREAECQVPTESSYEAESSSSSSSDSELEGFDDGESFGQRTPTNSYGSNLDQNENRRPFPWALGRFH